MSIFIHDKDQKTNKNQQDKTILGKDASVDIMEMGTDQKKSPAGVGLIATKDIFGHVVKKNGLPVEERRDIFGNLIEQRPVGAKGAQSRFIQNGEDAFKEAFGVAELGSLFTDLLTNSSEIKEDKEGLHVKLENGHTLDYIKELEDMGEFIGITDPAAIKNFDQHDARAIVLAAKELGYENFLIYASENEAKNEKLLSLEAQREGLTIANMSTRTNDRFSAQETVHNLEDFIGDRRVGENFYAWLKRRDKENKNSLTRDIIKDFFYTQIKVSGIDGHTAPLTDKDGNIFNNAEDATNQFMNKYNPSNTPVDQSLDNWLEEMIGKFEKENPDMVDGLKRVRARLHDSVMTANHNVDKKFESDFVNLVNETAPIGIKESIYASSLIKDKEMADALKRTEQKPKPSIEASVLEPSAPIIH